VLRGSRHAYEQYTAPLGICWMVTPNQHYGPSPDGYEYQAWGTYHKADRNAIGIDRTADGTGYVLQYPEALRRRFESTQTCPDELLLFFHRLPYTFKMRDGRTLIQRIYDDHFEGYEWVERAASILKALPLPDFDRALVDERIGRQLHNAREWRDIINTFFHRLSGIEDVHERKIYR
jgi:alpha-glucuronidase family protein